MLAAEPSIAVLILVVRALISVFSSLYLFSMGGFDGAFVDYGGLKWTDYTPRNL